MASSCEMSLRRRCELDADLPQLILGLGSGWGLDGETVKTRKKGGKRGEMGEIRSKKREQGKG